MTVFAHQLWREWREHRFALGLLVLLLPAVTWLLALQLSNDVRADPLFPLGVASGFAIVMLVGVGGETLGVGRRGARWLERLPSGLAGAFGAKLVFAGAMLVLVTVYGHGVGAWIAGGRSGPETRVRFLAEFRVSLALSVLVLGAWTFAASAWAQRGGLALLGAALVLVVLGFPVWRLVEAGYLPRPGWILGLWAVLLPTALLSAWLGFVHGGRLGRDPGFAAALGLAPVLPVLVGVLGWSSGKLAERDALDPLAPSFASRDYRLTGDGRTAFVFGQHRRPGWHESLMPLHALRIDLERGTHEVLGRLERVTDRYRADGRGHCRPEAFELTLDGRAPLLFGAETGEPRAWSAEATPSYRPRSMGLGCEFRVPGGHPAIHDPFRGRAYPLAHLDPDVRAGRLLVRPGRWLCAPSPVRWYWFDPDTNARTPTDWADHSRPLVLLEDGRILLAEAELGLRWIEPATGRSSPLDSQGFTVEQFLENSPCRRTPLAWLESDAASTGPIVLLTNQDAWLVLAEGFDVTRRVAVPPDVCFVRFVDEHTALVRSWRSGSEAFAHLDLERGRLSPLWPPASAFRPAAE